MTPNEVAASLERTREDLLSIPSIGAFLGGEALARTDGLFVVRLNLAPNFDPRDLSELALAVSMLVKQKLGHVHFYHDFPSAARRRTMSIALSLTLYPLELAQAGWPRRFAQRSLTDSALANATTIRPIGARRERRALIALRRSFLQAAETVDGRLMAYRKLEQERFRRPGFRVGAMIYGAALAAVLGLMLDWQGGAMGWPPKIQVLIGFVLSTPLIAIALFSGVYARVYDLQRLKLLRSASGFFHYLNPFNRIISRLGIPNAPAQVDEFSDLIDLLREKLAGEEHRLNMKLAVMNLCVAATIAIFAIVAIGNDSGGGFSRTASGERTAVAPAEVGRPHVFQETVGFSDLPGSDRPSDTKRSGRISQRAGAQRATNNDGS